MMKTEKLYYKDAYIGEFSATVISCERTGERWCAVLDKTAFFPEEGGQYADTGTLGECRVLDVQEKEGVILHTVDKPLSAGTTVCGRLDFAARLEKMRSHTAEHILCGIIHSLTGAENTGFHLGDDEVTFDISIPIDAATLLEVERRANLAVMANIPVVAYFPDTDALPQLTYRSKLELTEDVRIVDIAGVDSCACCAPHVAYTGEIGLIKLIDSVKHRGGSRIRMLAGERAYDYVARTFADAHAVSAALSAPVTELAAGLAPVLAKRDALAYELVGARRELAAALAEGIAATDGNAVVYSRSLDEEGRRLLLTLGANKVGGTLVALSGDEGAYRYVLLSHAEGRDFSAIVSAANAALGGKGGGRPPMAQGTYSAQLSEIKAYFDVK